MVDFPAIGLQITFVTDELAIFLFYQPSIGIFTSEFILYCLQINVH